jgi:hypothetical protein
MSSNPVQIRSNFSSKPPCVKEERLSLVWLNAFADASILACASKKSGVVVPHKRKNPCGTPGFFQ